MALIIFVLYLLSFLLIWQFVGYPVFMGLIALRAKPLVKDYSYQPFVSIIVPTYNEEKVIEKRTENLFDLDYPKDKYEVIVVNSGSTDNTASIVESLIKQNTKTKVQLLKEKERYGKASAINYGKKHAKGEIILITDANSIFDKNVLTEMMPHFKNSEVGAVGGQFVVLNPDNSRASPSQFYWDIEYILRLGESKLDSACLFHGEINAWRKDLVIADTKLLAEDLDVAIQIRRRGFKIEYEPNARVYEPVPTKIEEQIERKKTVSIGTIQCILKHWKYFLFPRDLYSLVIFPSHKSLAMISPFLLLGIPLMYFISRNVQMIFVHILVTLFFFGLLLVVLMKIKSKLKKPFGTDNGFSISKITSYVLSNEYSILLAWKDFLLRNYSVLWEKAESTRIS